MPAAQNQAPAAQNNDADRTDDPLGEVASSLPPTDRVPGQAPIGRSIDDQWLPSELATGAVRTDVG